MNVLEKLRREIVGKPMNKRQLKLLHELREKVRLKQISVAEAHQIWKSKQAGIRCESCKREKEKAKREQ